MVGQKRAEELNDPANEPPVETTTVDPPDTPEAKARLLEAARRFDPLAPLRRNPFTTVGAAAVLGVVAASPAAAHSRAARQVVAGTGRFARWMRRVGRIAAPLIAKWIERRTPEPTQTTCVDLPPTTDRVPP